MRPETRSKGQKPPNSGNPSRLRQTVRNAVFAAKPDKSPGRARWISAHTHHTMWHMLVNILRAVRIYSSERTTTNSGIIGQSRLSILMVTCTNTQTRAYRAGR